MGRFKNKGIMIDTNYGDRLLKYRTDNGLTQQIMADRTGLTQSTINKLEKQDIRLTLDTAEIICKGIPEIDFIWLLTGYDKSTLSK